ncbi:hypothetical protein GCM10027445_09860 [Amycolatopsis endophytica]
MFADELAQVPHGTALPFARSAHRGPLSWSRSLRSTMQGGTDKKTVRDTSLSLDRGKLSHYGGENDVGRQTGSDAAVQYVRPHRTNPASNV